MWYKMGFGIVFVLSACSFEESDASRVEGRGSPFPLRFEKESEGVGTDVHTVVDGILDAWMIQSEVSMDSSEGDAGGKWAWVRIVGDQRGGVTDMR